MRGIGVPALEPRFNELCLGNRYTTTLHVINSAVVKLGKLQKAEKVYRGMAGGVLPEQFWTASEQNVKGGCEYGFLSTTTQALHRGGTVVASWWHRGSTVVATWWHRGGTVVAPWWHRGGIVVAPWWHRGGIVVAALWHRSSNVVARDGIVHDAGLSLIRSGQGGAVRSWPQQACQSKLAAAHF